MARSWGIQVQLTVSSCWIRLRVWGVASLMVFGKKRQDYLWLHLTRSWSSRCPTPRGIELLPSPVSSYSVASGMDVHWLGLWNYTVLFGYIVGFHYPSGPRMLCYVTYQMIGLGLLSVIWQPSFSSLGTFALCDGDFPRWDFYSGPRYGIVTAGGDASWNAWPGGGASLRVSAPLLWPRGSEVRLATGCLHVWLGFALHISNDLKLF